MKRRYGTSKAVQRSKGGYISKGQRELCEALRERLNCTSITMEKKLTIGSYNFFADIFINEHNVIVEYHGDFYHCNPKLYEQNFFHPVKRAKAQTIWNRDAKRKRLLEKGGYKVIVVWEDDFKNKRKKVVDEIVEMVEKQL